MPTCYGSLVAGIEPTPEENILTVELYRNVTITKSRSFEMYYHLPHQDLKVTVLVSLPPHKFARPISFFLLIKENRKLLL
jgi:hypothetical protein